MNNEGESNEIPAYRDLISQLGPIDQLLGSVSYSDTDSIEGKTQQLRTSARVFKKMKFDLSNAAPEKKEKKEDVKPEEVKQPEIKRPCNPLWTSDEKDMFFDALNEYGKDFESIHMYFMTRSKKKGIPDDLIKTKHQIRHFFHKTFNILHSKVIFSDRIPKNAQELYVLINFGEIRRKAGTVPKKTYSKLNELIRNGSIALRIKGKTIRVKTPMCRALRRLNQLDEKYDDLKLPTRVLVELKPKDMVSFLKVQGMAQNPRIKVALSLQKRLSSLINCISGRWKTTDAIVYDQALISTNVTTKDCIPDQKTIDENSALLTAMLRLTPPPNTHIELPSIDISEYFTGQSICLKAFEMRKSMKEEIKKEETSDNVKTEKSPTGKQNDEDTGGGKEAKPSTSTKVEIADLNKCDKNDAIANSKILSLEEQRMKIEEIQQGWTLENCGSLTIGEMYLMFGANSRLPLEYNWDDREVKEENPDSKKENHLSTSLKKLLSLAKLQSTETKQAPKCTCGHVCGAKSNNNAQFKKPVATKLVKKNQVVPEPAPESEANVIESKSDPVVEDTQSSNSNGKMLHLFTQLDTMQRLNPRSKNRGKSRCRQLVVERKLIPNKSESKHQIVSMNIISQENKPNGKSAFADGGDRSDVLANSTPSILPVDAVESCSGKDFSGLLSVDQHSASSLSTGISAILRENENQWINENVSDYSLSSLLGHLDCPVKTNAPGISTEDTQLSHDVDSQLRTLFIESSIDYTAKFADLAAQVVDNKK